MLVRIDNSIMFNGIKPNMPHAMQLIKESNKYYLKTDLGVAMYNHLNRLPIK